MSDNSERQIKEFGLDCCVWGAIAHFLVGNACTPLYNLGEKTSESNHRDH